MKTKKIVFHKGDFYLKSEHDGKGGSSPIRMNDGGTEMYWHLYCHIKGLVSKDGIGMYGKMKHITRELATAKNALTQLEKKLKQVKLFDTKYRIKDVEDCACYKLK